MITYSKDDRHTIIGTGIITPLAFAITVLGQFAMNAAWLPEPQFRFLAYFDPKNWHRFTMADWGFWCLTAGELGLIFACLGWFCFANVKKLEGMARPFVLFGYLGLCIAVIGLVVGVFRGLMGIR